MAVTISYAQWEQALVSIGWDDPYPRELWDRLGGADSLTLERERIDQLASSLGWSEAHAEKMWEAARDAAPDLPPPPLEPPPPEESPVAGGPPLMPWERSSAPPAEKKAAKAKAAKITLPALPALDRSLALRRLAASLVDGLVFLAALLAVCQLGGLEVSAAIGQQGPGSQALQLALVLVTVTAVMLLYFSWSMRRPASPGQSLGKQALSLRVVCTDGSPISPRQILLREGVGVVLVPWLVALGLNLLIWPLGLVAAAGLLAASCLAVGLADRLANTKVIAA